MTTNVDGEKRIHIRSFHSFSGGVGKSHLAAALAAHFSSKNGGRQDNVLVIDTDLTGAGHLAALYAGRPKETETLAFWDLVKGLSVFGKRRVVVQRDNLDQISGPADDDGKPWQYRVLSAQKADDLAPDYREVVHSNFYIGGVIRTLAQIVSDLAQGVFEGGGSDVYVIIDGPPFFSGLSEELFLWVAWLAREEKRKRTKKVEDEAIGGADTPEAPFFDAGLRNASEWEIDARPYVVLVPAPEYGYPVPIESGKDLPRGLKATTTYLGGLMKRRGVAADGLSKHPPDYWLVFNRVPQVLKSDHLPTTKDPTPHPAGMPFFVSIMESHQLRSRPEVELLDVGESILLLQRDVAGLTADDFCTRLAKTLAEAADQLLAVDSLAQLVERARIVREEVLGLAGDPASTAVNLLSRPRWTRLISTLETIADIELSTYESQLHQTELARLRDLIRDLEIVEKKMKDTARL